MYYEYWGLTKPPFDNVPDPSMYVDAHESVENTVAETLFAIEEGNECVAVIIGDVGLGKTLSLRLILDSLPTDRYRIAFITNPDMSFIQLLREVVGQLTGTPCEIKSKPALLETFNRLLFEVADEGKKVLLFIDEANALAPANLESLRLLTNMQDDDRNLFTMILAGQIELAKRLEHPKRANFFQRVGTYSRIEKIKSPDLVRVYVETRLRLAGAERRLFEDDVYDALWIYSEQGVPRLINKICKLSLKAGETNGMALVNTQVVTQIGERFSRMAPSAAPKRKPRRETLDLEVRQGQPETVGGQEPKTGTVPEAPATAAAEPVTAAPVVPEQAEDSRYAAPAPEATPEATPDVVEFPTPPPVCAAAVEEADPLESSGSEGFYLDGAKVEVTIPDGIMEEALRASPDQRDRLAGMLAARTLEENPRLNSPVAKDPVATWGAIRDFILLKLQDRKQAC